MASYISLTNELLRRLNEATIATSDFADVRNVQALAKDAINSSVRHICQSAQEWPFTRVVTSQTLTEGVQEYSYPSDFSTIDSHSFYLKRDASLDASGKALEILSYHDYLRDRRPQDEAGAEGVPEYIYQTQDDSFGVTPSPDAAYEIEYTYWSVPDDMSASSDVCSVPTRFKHVVIDGAMMYMMRFRSNEQSAALHRSDFEKGIETMRRLLTDDILFMRSTMIAR